MTIANTIAHMFLHTFFLPANANHFEALQTSVSWEQVGKGRAMATLVNSDDTAADALVPVVRSTTVCHQPAQWFKDAHHAVLRDMQVYMPEELKPFAWGHKFNNAMLEKYTPECRSMAYHSDLALDLHPDSYIAIFSCYDSPQATKRKLVIKDKTSHIVTHEIVLKHNMVTLFSVDTNQRNLHKIVLDWPKSAPRPKGTKPAEGLWIGMTCRTSRMFVAYDPMLGCALRLATPSEHKEFLRQRAQENKLVNFNYGHVSYTVSPGDLLLPTN
jgi:hypothetical protein